MHQIIKALALSEEHLKDSRAELWGAFFWELESHHLDPKDISSLHMPRMKTYELGPKSERTTITLDAFMKAVAQHRGGRK